MFVISKPIINSSTRLKWFFWIYIENESSLFYWQTLYKIMKICIYFGMASWIQKGNHVICPQKVQKRFVMNNKWYCLQLFSKLYSHYETK